MNGPGLSAHFESQDELTALTDSYIRRNFQNTSDEDILQLWCADQRTPLWHQARRGRIGGSKVASVTNRNPYTNDRKALLDMLFGMQRDSRMESNCNYGTQTEDIVEGAFLAALDAYWVPVLDKMLPGGGRLEFEIEHPGTFVTNEERFCIFNASPDGVLVVRRDGEEVKRFLVEYKSPAGQRFYPVVPSQYVAQIQLYMGLLGLDACFFAVWVAGPERTKDGETSAMEGHGGIQIDIVPFDAAYFNAMIDEANAWFRRLYVPNRILADRRVLQQGVTCRYDFGLGAPVDTPSPAAGPGSTFLAEVENDSTGGPITAVVFDTETTALNGVVLQLAFQVLRGEDVVLERCQLFHLPAGYAIHPGAQKVHGISADQCETDGVDPRAFLGEFVRLLHYTVANGGHVVAHNYQFDQKSVNRTLEAWDMPASKMKDKMPAASWPQVVCTMKRSRARMRDMGLRCTNSAVYEYLVGPLPTGVVLHDAGEDTRVTAALYLAGRKKDPETWW